LQLQLQLLTTQNSQLTTVFNTHESHANFAWLEP
jgi:hypothetical protein